MLQKITSLLFLFTLALSIILSTNCTSPTGSVDTLYISSVDTLRIIEKDTVVNKDTVVEKDSVFIFDTNFTFDTVLNIDTVVILDTMRVIDSTYNFDTVFIKDSLLIFDTVFNYDTLIKITKDTIYKYDTIYNIITFKDTLYIAGGNRIHVFFGQFSTSDSISWSDNVWRIQLPIIIGNDWIGLTYTCPYSNWSSHTPIEFTLSNTGLPSWVVYAFNGLIAIWDIDLKLLDEYWQIILIEPI